MLEEMTLAEVLDGFASDAETFFTVLNDDTTLDADDKADLTRKFEEIAELVDEAKKIVVSSSENDT